MLKLLLNGLYPRSELVAEVLNASDGQTKSVLDLGKPSSLLESSLTTIRLRFRSLVCKGLLYRASSNIHRCLDMAHQFPHAQIVGVDIDSGLLQSNVPNCRFEVRDLTKSLSPFYGQFDFIHMRCVTGVIFASFSSISLTNPIKAP